MAGLTLAQPLHAGDHTISLTGPLLLGARLLIEDEACEVETVITPTQGRIRRGQEGTLAVPHAKGVAVRLVGPQAPVMSHDEITPEILAQSVAHAVCPLCGHAL